MDRLELFYLQADLPTELVELTGIANKVVESVEEIQATIQVKSERGFSRSSPALSSILITPEFIIDDTKLREDYKTFIRIYTSFLRRRKSKAVELGADEVKNMISDLLDEIASREKVLFEDVRSASITSDPKYLSFYYSTIVDFPLLLLKVVEVSKKEWYAKIGLEPYHKREKMKEIVDSAIQWSMQRLDEASDKLLSHMLYPIEKDISTVKSLIDATAWLYEKRVFSIL